MPIDISANVNDRACHIYGADGGCVEDQVKDDLQGPFQGLHDGLHNLSDTIDSGHDAVKKASAFLNGTPAPKNRLLRIPVDAVVGGTDLALTVGGHTAIGAAGLAVDTIGGPISGLGKLFGGIWEGLSSIFGAAAPAEQR